MLMAQESDKLLGGSSRSDIAYSTIIILPNNGSEDHIKNHRDIKPISTKFIMNKTVSITSLICCIIAAVIIATTNHRQDTNSSPASLETLLRNPNHSSSFSLHFHNGPSSTIIKDEPLSTKSPHELGIAHYNNRPKSSCPGQVFGSSAGPKSGGVPLPTNEWYLNLLVGLDDTTPGPNGDYENFASESNRVHTIPYILDTVGPIIGIRMHYPYVLGYGTIVQSNVVTLHGVTVGTSDFGFTRRYTVDKSSLGSKLGIGLQWTSSKSQQKSTVMTTSIIRGMPYGTMEYGVGIQPVVASETAALPPLIDGKTRMTCGTIDGKKLIDSTNLNSSSITVNSDVELYFPESDHTWLVFFSAPVSVRCYINPKKMVADVSLPPGAESSSTRSSVDNRNAFQLRVDPTSTLSNEGKENLIVRIALANNCTTGTNPNFCDKGRATETSLFKDVLRNHADVYPTQPTVKYAFADPTGGLRPDSPNAESAYLFFDWMAKSYKGKSVEHLLMFALPHHIDILRQFDGTDSSNEVLGHCAHSLHGSACLVKGGIWAMEEVLGGLPSFMAPRPPNHRAISHIAAALSKDIKYSLPENYLQGVGDTYFSGKMLAKLGRIIVIAQELRGLAEVSEHNEPDASQEELLKVVLKCREANLPTEKEMNDAIARLRSSVEIWLNGSAATPFTYDTAWGGLVSCGCLFNDKEKCDNVFPDCPAYSDPGLDFGNGFYNDHHFHYGYHIYAAAIVAEYDREWGRKHFEQVLLYVRDIANPSAKDKYFPKFRQKDWYLGNSWASGIATIGGRPYLNGRNQESSSEAIAAYEAVSMFGSVMMKAFGNGISTDESYNKNANVACQIFNIGRFLTATEIRSADRYWHVYSPKRNKVYPDSYTPPAIGMMWDTMTQFQTWFGSEPYLAYGIQLLPLTPISERRDSDQWIRQLYPSYAASCEADPVCVKEGWSVMVYAVLATLGHQDAAINMTLDMPHSAFNTAGGNGHSLTNTLWYIASRPTPIVPYDLDNPSTTIDSVAVPASEQETILDCGCPDTCNSDVLSTNADEFTCKERIQWLVKNRGISELGACRQVSVKYHGECGLCDPELCSRSNFAGCPPCDEETCLSDINQCQKGSAPFLCYEGTSIGGCSSTPWDLSTMNCVACCQLYDGCEGTTIT